MNFEVCTDSLEGALAAKKYGAQRIELCAALSIGGLTPSYGLIEQCVLKSNIQVHAMIRPKEGGFDYSIHDIELMKTDIAMSKQAGATGVVFGVLDENFKISKFNYDLLKFAKSLGLEVTFHRAFDFVSDYKTAIESIISFGFDRLLTSGLQTTAMKGLDLISELQSDFGKSIQIMAGSGINESNALKIASSGINHLHFTARKKSNSVIKLSMGESFEVDALKISRIINQFEPG